MGLVGNDTKEHELEDFLKNIYQTMNNQEVKQTNMKLAILNCAKKEVA